MRHMGLACDAWYGRTYASLTPASSADALERRLVRA